MFANKTHIIDAAEQHVEDVEEEAHRLSIHSAAEDENAHDDEHEAAEANNEEGDAEDDLEEADYLQPILQRFCLG